MTGCRTCNADGTCRDREATGSTPLSPALPPAAALDAATPEPPIGSEDPVEMPPTGPDPSGDPDGEPIPDEPDPDIDDDTPEAGVTPDPGGDENTPDAGVTPGPGGDDNRLDAGVTLDSGIDATPDAGAPEPPDPDVPEVCAQFRNRTSDSLCLNGDEQCFSLGSVLSPALTAWLDPTTLPTDGSRHWCDRSGQRHHALLLPAESELRVASDARAVSDALARSVELDDSWLSLGEGKQPALSSGNFAVLIAAAAPLDASDDQAFELFESGDLSRINLTIVPSTGKVEGKITSEETALVTAPVVTRSSVYDSSFHLYSLYRRSEVRVLDDVLQLRLNGVLEARSSSIAIPRALDLSSSEPPRFGSRTTSHGVRGSRGRVAAVVVLRGSVPEDELARLENFFCTALAVCAAPAAASAPGIPPFATAPRAPVTPPPPTDAGP